MDDGLDRKEFPSGKLDRGKVIAKTGLKIGTNYAKYHLDRALGKAKNGAGKSELNKKNAEELFREFSKLRGTALKLAQGLSMDRSLLPQEFADVLTKAQYAVPPKNPMLVRHIIKKELGGWPEEVFRSFEKDACAAASLGQVHKAVTKDGRKVAVKVQYPNVRDTIESDLAMAKVVFKAMVSSDKSEIYFDEVRSRLLEETDYRLEGKNIMEFRQRYAGAGVETPEWVEELSTSRVLCMSWIVGIHMNEFLSGSPEQDTKDHYGQLIWDFFHRQINDSYTVHADSHPGNYLFTNDGNLGVLDYGCVKVCPPAFFRNYLRLFLAHRDRDMAAIEKLYYDLEIFRSDEKDKKEERRFFEYTLRLGKLFVSPYNVDIFDFGDEDVIQQFNEMAREAADFREPRGSRHFIYVARAHIGMYQMLMKLGSKVDVRPGRDHLYRFLENENIEVK